MKKKNNQPRLMHERLQEEMLNSGLNCTELAKKLGKERKTIYSWRDGSTSPDALSLAKICVIFNVSADYLLFGGVRYGRHSL